MNAEACLPLALYGTMTISAGTIASRLRRGAVTSVAAFDFRFEKRQRSRHDFFGRRFR